LSAIIGVVYTNVLVAMAIWSIASSAIRRGVR
jgi:hypothetical protein